MSFDFNSLLSDALGAAPGVVQALTGKPATAGSAAVAPTPSGGPPVSASQVQSKSAITSYLPWIIGGGIALALGFGAMMFLRKR